MNSAELEKYIIPIIFALLFTTLFQSCTGSNERSLPKQLFDPREDLAKNVVIRFLEDTLEYYDSLKIGKFSKIDSSYTTLLEDAKYFEYSNDQYI